jgi:hypothetical protein
MATNKKPEPKAAAAPKSKPKAEAAPKTTSKPKPEPAPAAAAPLNREQRRRAKFGKAGNVHQHDPVGPWPESGVNPALIGAAVTDEAAHAGGPDQDVTHEIGTGSGGATEEAGRKPHREGARPGNSTKG